MMKILNSFLAGLTIGILFAPHSGKKTRQKISGCFTDYKDNAKDYFAGAAESVESKAHDVKESIQNL